MTLPSGTVVAFTFDADGNRTQKSMTPSGGSASVVNDTYDRGPLQYQKNGSGTLLASFTYDGSGVPVSVKVGRTAAAHPVGASIAAGVAIGLFLGSFAILAIDPIVEGKLSHTGPKKSFWYNARAASRSSRRTVPIPIYSRRVKGDII